MGSWKYLLLRIGDKCPEYGPSSDSKDHIETCFGALRRELEHSEDDVLLQFLLSCSEQLPHKIPLYGTLIGLINLEYEDFVRKLVEKTQTMLQSGLDSGDCNRVRILMRLMTVMMCSKVLQPSSLVVVFETLLSSAATTVDEEKGNPAWQPCADFYITCILSCLPWGGAELIEQVPEEIERVMVGIEAYLSIRRHTSDTGLSFFENDNETADKDFLEDLWDRIQVLSRNGWKVESVPRPHLSFEAQLVAGKSHEFGPISCPSIPNPPALPSGINFGKQKHEAELQYPQRIRRLNIYPPSKFEDLQPIDRFVVEEYLLDVLLFFNGSRKECASFMVGLPVPFRYEFLMAETIFSQLLMLPQPPFKPIYYTLVIIDLCKALPGAFPAVVAGAVRTLFEKIADLDMECRTRLILWFSHHLSNFQFIWPWEEWAYALDLPKWAPQRVFVQEVLEREVRLSYWDKVKQSIENAPGLEELLPPKGGSNYSLGAEDGKENTENALSGELNNMVKGRVPIREIVTWIEENVVPNNGLEVALRVVIQTLLNIGSKSFTHLITVLERYGQVIAKLCSDQDKQVMLIAEVSSFWKSNTQMTAIAIDRMMGYRLVSNLAIVRWVFSAENTEQFHTSDRPWEVLRNAVSKTYNRISDLRKEILSLQKSVLSAEEAAKEVQAELEAAESKLTLVDGEPVLGENPVRLNRLKLRAEKAKEEAVSLRQSLEAKEALLGRAIEENEALFLSLYKNFSNVLMERLAEGSVARTLHELKSANTDVMAVDTEEPSAMELDKENKKTQNSQSNGERTGNTYNVGEKEQWCITTLGYVKSFSRQYASEIWPLVEKLDAEVLTEDAPCLFREAVYSGLRRPISEEVNFSEEGIQSLDALAEMSQGNWEGSHRSEIYTPEVLGVIDRFQPDFSPPSGESLRQVEFRMINFLNGTVLGLPEKLRIDLSSHHQNESPAFAQHNSNVLTNSIHEQDGSSLQPTQWDLLHRHRPVLSRKKSGKSRLQVMTTTGDEIEDEMSPSESNHQSPIHNSSFSSYSASVSCIGIFSHSVPIKCLLTGILGCSPLMSHKICIDDSSVTVLQHSLRTGWQIKRFNDTSHLRLL